MLPLVLEDIFFAFWEIFGDFYPVLWAFILLTGVIFTFLHFLLKRG